MRKVVFYGAMSIDGYLADEQDSLQWLFDTNLAGVSTYEAFIEQVDTVVMGKTTYDEVKKMLGEEPLYPGKQKIVFTHQMQGSFPEGRYVAGDVSTIIKDLKVATGKWIWIVGGGGLVTSLMASELIDDYWIQLAPVFLGVGKRLFPEGDYEQRVTFVEATQMGEMVELHYQKKQMTKKNKRKEDVYEASVLG